MKKFVRFPDIKTINVIAKNVAITTAYIGQNENDEPIYDGTIPKPHIKFTSTCKAHGSNGGCCMNYDGEIWAQSRKNIITVDKDNAGFAFFVEKNIDIFRDMLSQFEIEENEIVSIFGEWFGKGIQAKVSISKVEKTFAIFAVKVSSFSLDEFGDEKVDVRWILPEDFKHLKSHEHRIYSIYDFKTWEIDIDFNNYQLSMPELLKIKDDVEKQCPIGLAFGEDGIGEGIVIQAFTEKYGRLVAKIKGVEHASGSKPKKDKIVDTKKAQEIYDISYKLTPIWRLDQMLTETCNLNNGGDIERKLLGEYIKAVIKDIHKEEMDILIESGYEPKEFNKSISKIARDYFFDREHNEEI